MQSLALPFFAIGAVIFLVAGVYALIDHQKTGILFRQKRIVLPIMAVSGLIALSGFTILYTTGGR